MSVYSTSGAAEGTVLDRALAIAALVLLGALAVAGFGGVGLFAVVGLGVVVALAFVSPARAARPLSALVALIAILAWARLPWQLTLASALALFAVVGRVLPAVSIDRSWRALGRPEWGWSAVVGGVTPLALLGWLFIFHPNLDDVRALVPPMPFAILVLGGVGFAIVNATLEELVWRGVLQDRLGALFGSGTAIALQAASFGVQHAHGVPRGWVGVVLAGTWAVMLGLLRHKSRGLLAPILAHVVADATIAIIILARLG